MCESHFFFALEGSHYLRRYPKGHRSPELDGVQEVECCLTLGPRGRHLYGLPLAQEKTVRPSLQVTFLGVELDTVRNETRLPRDKLENYLEQLRDLKSKKFCTQRELKTLIGKLQFATCVIQGGRGFLRRLHDKWQGPFKPEARIFLSLSTKKDLEVWENFLQVWIGSKLSSFIQMRMCNFTPLQQKT